MAESARVLSGYREQLTAKQAELTRFSGQFSQLKQAYEGRDVLKERAGQLERLLHLRAISKEQDELKERHRKGEEIVVATRREIEVLQELLTIRELEKILADKESGLEDIRVDLKENSVENEKLNRLISNSNKLMEKFKEDNFDFAK